MPFFFSRPSLSLVSSLLMQLFCQKFTSHRTLIQLSFLTKEGLVLAYKSIKLSILMIWLHSLLHKSIQYCQRLNVYLLNASHIYSKYFDIRVSSIQLKYNICICILYICIKCISMYVIYICINKVLHKSKALCIFFFLRYCCIQQLTWRWQKAYSSALPSEQPLIQSFLFYKIK